MRALIYFFAANIISCNALADNPKYPVSQIPEDLKKDANAVIREYKTVFQILGVSKAKVHTSYAVTILNSKAKSYASETLSYDKLSKISDFNAIVFDEAGNQIKKLKNKDIIDQSAYDGFSLYSDYRLKHADLTQTIFPFTVYFDYSIDYDFLYEIPDVEFVPGENVSVQSSAYEIIFPTGLGPRFKQVNLDLKPTQNNLPDGLKSLLWKVENLKSMRREPLGPSLTYLAPKIIIAPTIFNYGGYPGDMSTWESYGKWQQSLNEGRDVLPAQTKEKVKQLTANLPTIEAKAKALYEYLQSRTRYVSIQIGIGGFQPFEARVVDEVGYGDCKALSNYMVALLKAAGVEGYYCTVMAGKNAGQVLEDFPSDQSNHIIVAVPNKADTVWLECTSQTNPFGYLGTFTGDRKALLISKQGAKLVNTIHYTAEDNIQSRTANVTIEMTGDAKAKVQTMYKGIEYENDNLDQYLDFQNDDQKKWVQNTTSIPTFDVNSFSMKDLGGKIPMAIVNLDLNLKRYTTISGKRIFFTPNLMNKSSFIPEKVDSRKTNFFLKSTYTHLDTVKYKLPEGIYPEFLPEPVKFASRFGEYEASVKLDQGNLVYIRRVKMNKGEYPANTYQEMVDFFKGINKADNMKMVFMNKT
jgi:hypothetical protein